MVRDEFDEFNTPKINIISRIFSSIFLIASIYFVVKLGTVNILPTKYFVLTIVILAILNFVFALVAFRCKTTKRTQIIYDIITILLSIAVIIAQSKLGDFEGFVKSNFVGNQKKYAVYDVIVSSKSTISTLRDLKGKEFFTYEEPVKEVSNEDLKTAVKNTIADSSLVFKEDLEPVMNRVLVLNDSASIVNNGTFESYISVNEDYEEKIRVVGEIKIEIKDQVDNSTDADKSAITDSPFLLYISGIDTRTGSMPSRSLSDVNIVAAINPYTKKILFVNIPRDSYVMIHGDTGLPDKLTHAGSRGGVELSMATIEDLLGLKLNRNFRLNFNFLEGFVNKIGGISVQSSEDHTIVTLHNRCTINPGENFVDGRCALGFVRERKSLKDGDIQRGKNQMHVLVRIVEKISKDKNLINNLSDYLNSLNGSFDTNISSEDITSLIKMQIDDMSGWSVETYSIEGTGQMGKTHSYPNQDLYILIQDENMVNTAKQKLSKTLGY
ncbi:LCP family protein [Candidatus Saccharibacteria bacterium]|nr:LCP family protein [Candidatus Saccharibacteria bacterium]